MSVGERTITRPIGGKDYQFKKLTPYDRVEILRKLKAQKRESLLADLKAVGAEKEEMLGELRALDEVQYGEREFIGYVNSLDGRLAIIERSMVCGESERQEIRDAMSDPAFDPLILAAELCNLSLTAPDEAYGEDSPNPPTAEPETYQTPPKNDTASTTAAA
jgi:hypothetical protein